MQIRGSLEMQTNIPDWIKLIFGPNRANTELFNLWPIHSYVSE